MLAAALFAVFANVEYLQPKDDTFSRNVVDDNGTVVSHSYYSPGNSSNVSAMDLYRMKYGSTSSAPKCDTDNVIPDRWHIGWGTTPYWFAVTAQQSIGEGVDDRISFQCVASEEEHIKPESNKSESGFGADYHAIKDSGEKIGPMQWILDRCDNGYTVKCDYVDTLTVDQPAKDFTYWICAPEAGTILTSHYGCDYGHTMDYEFAKDGNTYLMHIENARCWYCCRNKKATDANDIDADGCMWNESTQQWYYQANTLDSLQGHQCTAACLLVLGTVNTQITFTKTSN